MAVAIVLGAAFHPAGVLGADRIVADSAALAAALADAVAGDRILLEPGTYSGGLYRFGLQDVTIASVDPARPAVISGGINNLQLSDASGVVIEDLHFADAFINGLNIDDGGTFASPSSNIALRRIVVRDTGSSGNHDGIKLSGVTGFHIDRVVVSNWGTGGSAVNPVGCHDGLIENSWFRHDNPAFSGTVVRPKGGSKRIAVRANRIDVPIAGGRAIQFGGSTGAAFFRFVDGDSGYEAAAMTAAGNVIAGAQAAFSWVNIDGGVFHHNLALGPGRWVMRILNENPGAAIVDTRNGVFRDNVVVFGNGLSTTVNAGSETEPASFTFASNTWFNADSPAASTPSLPAPETDATVGVDPAVDPDGVIAWRFPWGLWLVNANDRANVFEVPPDRPYTRVTLLDGARFEPLADEPISGPVERAAIAAGPVQLAPFSQQVLITTAGGIVVEVPLPAWWVAVLGILVTGVRRIAARRNPLQRVDRRA